MKRKVLTALAIAIALVVTPVGGQFVTMVTASSNNSVTNSGNNTQTTPDDNNDADNENTSDNNASDNAASNTNAGGATGADAYTGAAITVTSSNGATVTSSVPTVNTSNIGSVALTTTRSAVNAAVGFTAAMAEAGQRVNLTVANSQCGPVAREVISNAAASVNATIAEWLEIDLDIVDREGWMVNEITELSAPIEIAISTPAIDNAANYDFAVIRLHNGQATVLPDLDSDPATITFKTDRFSVYAVVYGAKGSFDAFKTAAVKDSVPKTGDAMPMAAPMAVAGVAFAVAAVVLKKREEV